MAFTVSELCIKKIEAATRAIKMGVKTPDEVNPSEFFNKLLPLNDGMHHDLLEKYQNVVNDYIRKKTQQHEA